MATMTTSSRQPKRVATHRLVRVGALTIVASIITNLIIFAIASGGLGIRFTLPPEMGGSISASVVAVMSAVGVLGAVIAYMVIGHLARRPIRTYRIVAVIGLILSFAGPLSVATLDTSAKLVLALMHVAAAGLSIGLLTTLARE